MLFAIILLEHTKTHIEVVITLQSTLQSYKSLILSKIIWKN